MGKFLDLRGRVFGRLTVMKQDTARDGDRIRWLCRCSCGKSNVSILSASLMKGITRSCGCIRSEMIATRSTTHGMSRKSEYNIWTSMKDRCSNPNSPDSPDYHKRGIRVCSRWERFENFYADMGPRPPGFYIDRINNDGDYSPENCKWVSPIDSARNRRSNRILTFKGESKTMTEWSEILGIHQATLSNRINTYGWSVEKSLSTPARKIRKRRVDKTTKK